MDVVRATGILDGCDICHKVRLTIDPKCKGCVLPDEKQKDLLVTHDLFRKCMTSSSLRTTDFKTVWQLDAFHFQEIMQIPFTVVQDLPESPVFQNALEYISNLVLQQALKSKDRTPDSVDARPWKLFWLLPRLLLAYPIHKAKNQSVNSALINRVNRFLALDFEGLFEDALANVQHDAAALFGPDARPPGPTPSLKKLKKVEKETGNGNISKAFMILSSDSTYQDAADPEVRAKLLDIFKPEDPEKSTNGNPTFGTPLTKAIIPKDIKNAIAKDKNSVPGPSGWSFKLLKVVGKSTTSQTLLASLLNSILHQQCPIPLITSLRDGLLTVLDKSNGGVRPTVSSDAFLKLLSRCIGIKEQPIASSSLAPIQAGVGLKSGIEFVIHTVRLLLHKSPEWGCLQADLSHAYNSISLAAIQKQIRKCGKENAQLLAAYFDLFVAQPRELTARGNHKFTVHQGVI